MRSERPSCIAFYQHTTSSVIQARNGLNRIFDISKELVILLLVIMFTREAIFELPRFNELHNFIFIILAIEKLKESQVDIRFSPF